MGFIPDQPDRGTVEVLDRRVSTSGHAAPAGSGEAQPGRFVPGAHEGSVRFWDASGLIRLCVNEPETGRARALFDADLSSGV